MAVVPTAPTITDAVSSSSQMNQFRDAIRYLQKPPQFKLRQATSQSFTNNTDTPVTFDAEVLDTDVNGTSGHDNVTNNTRWTCTFPGQYEIAGTVTFGANATGIRWAGLRVNGTNVPASIGSQGGSAAEVGAVHSHTTKVYMDVGDYVELVGRQSSGGALSTYVADSWFQSALDGLWVST